MLLIFAVFYLVLLLAYITFCFHPLRLDYRMLSPVFPVALILAFRLVDRVLSAATRVRYARLVFALLCGTLTVAYAVRCGGWVKRVGRDGLGFSRREWVQSEILEHVRGLDPGVAIYTNAPDAVYYLAAKSSSMVPLRTSAPWQLKAMRRVLQKRQGVVVYFFEMKRSYLLTPDQLHERLPLEVLVEESDGIMYRLAGH